MKDEIGTWNAVEIEEGLWEVRQADWPQRLPVVVLDARRDGYEPFRQVVTPKRAKLIAAAPDLLEALKAMLIVMHAGPCPRKLDDAISWRDNDVLARRMATEAIAKAERLESMEVSENE